MTKALVVRLIRSYQKISRACVACGLRPLVLSGCRQWPTCSEYSIAAISEYGLLRGCAKAFLRVLHCNPLTLRHVH